MRNPVEWLLLAGRFVAVALGCGAIVATVVSAAAIPPPRAAWSELIAKPGNWDRSWAQIRQGMSREEVVLLLGPPALAEHTPEPFYACTDTYRYPDYSGREPMSDICFDSEGRVQVVGQLGMRFDLRSIIDGGGPLDAAPIGILLGLILVVNGGRAPQESDVRSTS